MFDVIIHSNEEDQLMSIKGFGTDFPSKQYFFYILKNLTQNCSEVLICVSRMNYHDYSTNRLTNDFQGIKDLEYDKNLTEISFMFSFSNDGLEDLLYLLIDLWHSYEQASFYFFSNNKDLPSIKEEILSKKISWKEVVKKSKSFVLFKGVEDDVLWIGKSKTLSFSEIQ